MPVIKVALDTVSFKRLAQLATEQRRPVASQAAVIVLQAIGCWPAPQEPADQPPAKPAQEPATCQSA
jgi:hypothetical protein